MALHFSGTALDIAIQQREQEISEENPAPDQPEQAPEATDEPVPEPSSDVDVDTLPTFEPTRIPVAVKPQMSETPAVTGVEIRRRRRAKVLRTTTEKSSKNAAEAMPPELNSFMTRWGPFLTETQIAICTFIYNNSIVLGQEYCFTSTPKLMAAVSKTERHVQIVLNRLTDWGLISKGETVVNAPREQRGTYYKLTLTKS